MKDLIIRSRRLGYNTTSMQFLLKKLTEGNSVCLVSKNNNYPQQEIDFLNSQGLNISCEPNIIKPNLSIIYNWNGSIRRFVYPEPYQNGWIIKRMEKLT